MGRALVVVWVFVALSVASTARAQAPCPPDHVGCERADVDFTHRDALFDGVMLDTGWVPAGSPIQVRFGVVLGGETRVELGGTTVTSWPAPLDFRVVGREDAGLLRIDYGFEVIARMRFNVRVAGVGYTWEGDIPRGTLPTDLRVADQLEFDPFVLPPSDPRPVLVYDETDPVVLYDLPLTSGLVSIPGFSGALRVTATASLEGSYQTDRIEVSDATGPIEVEGGSTLVEAVPRADGFGSAKDVTVRPVGVIGYDGVVTLRPSVTITIAGARFDLTPFDLPVPIADVSTDSDFDSAEVHVPLPDVDVASSLDLGAAPVLGAVERLLTIDNDGEAELSVSVGDPGAPFSVGAPSLTVPPRSSVRLVVAFAPTSPGPATGELRLETNDPDAPAVTIALTGLGEPVVPDAGMATDAGPPVGPDDGGCGCRVAPRPAPAWALALLALVAVRRARS